MKKYQKISFVVTFVLFSLFLFSLVDNTRVIHRRRYPTLPDMEVDPKMRDINVPPAHNSHYTPNNVPGMLPGPLPGETLGLDNNCRLSLLTPIRAPLVDGC